MSSLHFNFQKENQQAVYRLTTLWALNESGLGGVMHALKIPFTGIFVGGIAVVLISLIAHFSNNSFSVIFRSTVSVLIVKALVSPQSPVPAYIAVSFQGVFGGMVFALISNFKIASVIFALVAMLESAVQSFLITTLIFGKSIWQALDIFFKNILNDFGLNENFSFSFWLIIIYCLIYSIWGMLIGWWIAKLPMRIKSEAEKLNSEYNQLTSKYSVVRNELRKRKSKSLQIILMLAFISFVLLFQSRLESYKVIAIILRTLVIVVGWFVIVQPALKYFIVKFSKRNAHQSKYNIQQIIAALPLLKQLAQNAFRISSSKHKGFLRYSEFVFILIVLTLYADATE